MRSITSEYLTIPEAADLLRVSVSTVRRWIRDGTMTAHRAGQRRLLLKRADVIRAIRPVESNANTIARAAHSLAGPPNRDASPGETNSERKPNVYAREEAIGTGSQSQAGQEPLNIMTPETWEEIREGRELRTEQIMGEDDPDFDQFDIGVLAHMIVHSPDRPRRRLLTPDEQRQMLNALERAKRTSERIRQRSGVDKFPPSEDIIAEMREERIRQLLGEDDAYGETTT